MYRHPKLSISIILACMAPAACLAQTSYLEQSGIVGQGTLLTISRLPTQANGKVSYYDAKILLSVSSAGIPSLASANFPPSPKLVTNHFMGGRYYVKYGNQATQFGSLSSGVGSGGSTVWTLVMDQAPNGDFPQQASWQTGAPSPDVAARLVAAKVPRNPDYSYGTTEIGNHIYSGYAFNENNGLLAAEQVGATLNLVSYSYGNGAGDAPSQTGSAILGMCQNSQCSNAPQ